MADVSLSPSLFVILSGLIEERTGIHYELRDNIIFSSKVMARALEAGFESPLDYYYFLRYDDHSRIEFDALIEGLVVNETFFFREAAPLQVISDDVANAAAAGKRMRIWCAASSSGEEVLTLAMMLAEKQILRNVELVASDISDRVLARARAGIYGARSFRSTSEVVRAKWFRELGDGRAQISSSLLEAIQWRRINLADPAAVATMSAFDVVLCRNVLIYFSEQTVHGVVNRLASSLVDEGRLVVGASESLLRFGTMLVCEERSGSFFYRKAGS